MARNQYDKGNKKETHEGILENMTTILQDCVQFAVEINIFSYLRVFLLEVSILKLKVTQDNDNSFFHTQRPFYLHSTQCFIYLFTGSKSSTHEDSSYCIRRSHKMYSIVVWLLQVGVPLGVLCSYCGRSNRACSSCKCPQRYPIL